MDHQAHNISQEEPYIPHRLLLQWHITERCNLRCAHCYQNDYSGEELQFKDLLEVVQQFKDIMSFWRGKAVGHRARGHLTVTGGEPFVR